MLKIIQGDLFKSKDSIAHCISADFKMGAGVALEVRKRWINKFPSQREGQVGSCFPVEIEEGRYIFNLITKNCYWEKPVLNSLRWALAHMFALMKSCGVKSVSCPRIGCGIDQLEWSQVNTLLQEFCNKYPEVEVMVYELGGENDRRTK